MKKKIISILVIMAMLIQTFIITVNAADVTLNRSGGYSVRSIAQELKDVWLDRKIDAQSVAVDFNNIKIYQYNKNISPENLASSYTKYYESKYDKENVYYTIPINNANDTTINNVVTVIYQGGLKYNNKIYDVKINIKKITKVGTDKAEVRIRCGQMTGQTISEIDNVYYPQYRYTEPCTPQIGVSGIASNNTTVNVDLDYYIIDENGNEKQFSGVMGIIDLDLNQGFYLDNYKASSQNKNVFINRDEEATNNLKYKSIEDGTYFFSSTEDNTDGADIYALLENTNGVNMNLTFDSKTAYSSLEFQSDKVNKYYKIDKSVVGGTISERNSNSLTQIQGGSNRTIVFSPNDASRQYLKSITVDSTKQNISNINISDKWEFENINKDHSIEVVYGNIYLITYELNGGNNDSDNPDKFRDDDATIYFKNPTREGYDFKGWYEDAAFTKELPSFVPSERNSDVKVYAKWEAKKDIKYKVEHYLENDKGEYELKPPVEELTAEANSTVTATAKNFTGYVENKTASGRKASGVVTADGKLVLKLYYDKQKYTVKFIPKNDTEIDDQIVKFEEKAKEPTKPTKKDYTFEYWYLINDNNEEEKYDFDTPVVKDITLIAKWKEVEREPEVTPTPKDDTTPTPTPTPTDTDKTQTAGKVDNTQANKILPNTGYGMFICIIILVGTIGGIITFKYFKYKDIK